MIQDMALELLKLLHVRWKKLCNTIRHMSMNRDGINYKLHIKTLEAFESGSKASFAYGPGQILRYFNEPKNPRRLLIPGNSKC